MFKTIKSNFILLDVEIKSTKKTLTWVRYKSSVFQWRVERSIKSCIKLYQIKTILFMSVDAMLYRSQKTLIQNNLGGERF